MSALTGWPFWAPSDLEAVESALDLAGAVEGERVIDLGCGDGQVLVAAALRGCSVAGVECDEELADMARTALAENDLAGEVVLGDVFEFPLDADVIFTYLAPATLQRLVPRLQATAPGTRLVTVDFAVPGLEIAAMDHGRNRLYRLPATELPIDADELGWSSAGSLVAIPPDRHSLTTLTLHHEGGSVAVTATSGLGGTVAVQTGADVARPGEEIAVDLRWEELGAGTLVAGSLTVLGETPHHPVFGLVCEDEHGLWEITYDAVDRLTGRVARGWRPSTFDELLAACEAD